MKKTGVVIIPVRDEVHLKWIVETQAADYKKRASQELCLFDNEDFVLAETSIAHVILVGRQNDALRCLACVPVRDCSDPILATADDLRLLAYPCLDASNSANAKYVLFEVDTTHVQNPSLDIDGDQLLAFLQEQSLADVCSIHPLEELRERGVVMGERTDAAPPSTGHSSPSGGIRQMLGKEKREPVVPTETQPEVQTEVQPETPTDAPTEAYGYIRSARELLRVTFPDGTVLCDNSTTVTYAQTIEKIGPDAVAALGIEYCKTPLLSKEYSDNKNYKTVQREVGGGWLLFTQGSTATKMLLLMNISNQLNLGLKIERGTDLQPVTKAKLVSRKTVRNSIEVTLQDGTVITGENSRDVYVKTLRHIGLDKVRRLSLDIQGVPLVTTRPVAKMMQSDEHNGLYITIPNGTKKMYKYLLLIASFSHTRFTVTIK